MFARESLEPGPMTKDQALRALDLLGASFHYPTSDPRWEIQRKAFEALGATPR